MGKRFYLSDRVVVGSLVRCRWGTRMTPPLRVMEIWHPSTEEQKLLKSTAKTLYAVAIGPTDNGKTSVIDLPREQLFTTYEGAAREALTKNLIWRW